MDRFVLGLLIGLVIGAAGTYFFLGKRPQLPDVTSEDVRGELSRYGGVVKEKARDAGAVIADATADARTTAAIKSKLAAELGPSSLGKISVNTSEGVVTLSGTISSQAEIDKAVEVAYSIEGVSKVFTTLQIKKEE